MGCIRFSWVNRKRLLKRRPEQKLMDSASVSVNDALSARWVLVLVMIVICHSELLFQKVTYECDLRYLFQPMQILQL